MHSHWLETGTGIALLREETRQVADAFENIFGDQLLQVGAWGDPAMFRRYARTRRYSVVAATRGPGVDFVSLPEDLAVPTDSIDAVFLPHVLETTHDPYAVLREVDRILRPDGQVVATGFNPWGWWGVRHYLSRRRFPAGGQRMVSEYRLRDWLQLLDYNCQPARFHHSAPPLYRQFHQVNRLGEHEHSDGGDWPQPAPHFRGWSPLCSAYLLLARKDVYTVTLIRPPVRPRPRLVGGLVNPTTRNVA
ncbi:MAG: methyltransferase domain-containing protein [Gammaproteobacteria bacterium]